MIELLGAEMSVPPVLAVRLRRPSLIVPLPWTKPLEEMP
jgi:hypothetical protein